MSITARPAAWAASRATFPALSPCRTIQSRSGHSCCVMARDRVKVHTTERRALDAFRARRHLCAWPTSPTDYSAHEPRADHHCLRAPQSAHRAHPRCRARHHRPLTLGVRHHRRDLSDASWRQHHPAHRAVRAVARGSVRDHGSPRDRRRRHRNRRGALRRDRDHVGGDRSALLRHCRHRRAGIGQMALTATIYNLDVQLADTDRGVYEPLAFKVAQQPSESDEHMIARVLAYCLEYTEGIGFSKGIAEPEEPALFVRDLTGALKAWIDIGSPDAARLHKASKAAPRVAVYTHKDPTLLVRQLSGERIHRADQLELYALDRTLVADLVSHRERRTAFDLTVTERQLYLNIGGESLEGTVSKIALS